MNEFKRLAIIYCTPHILLEIMKNGCNGVRPIGNVLPGDTKYVRSFVDDRSGFGRIGIVIASESFAELEMGQQIPVLPDPLFEKV